MTWQMGQSPSMFLYDLFDFDDLIYDVYFLIKKIFQENLQLKKCSTKNDASIDRCG
jgi:hypothetical protein